MNFNLKKINNCGVSVTDTSQYLEKSIFATNTKHNIYTFQESATVDIFEQINQDGTASFVKAVILKHENNPNVECEFSYPNDGLFRITHEILPTYEWIQKYEKYLNDRFFDSVYYVKDDNIYKYGDKNPVSLNQFAQLNKSNSNVISQNLMTVSICVIEKCYEEAFKQSMNNIERHGDHLIRNLIQMFMDVINYCIYAGQFYEALIWIDKFYNCLTLKDIINYVRMPKKVTGCGCRQRKINTMFTVRTIV